MNLANKMHSSALGVVHKIEIKDYPDIYLLVSAFACGLV